MKERKDKFKLAREKAQDAAKSLQGISSNPYKTGSEHWREWLKEYEAATQMDLFEDKKIA